MKIFQKIKYYLELINQGFIKKNKYIKTEINMIEFINKRNQRIKNY